MASCPLLDPLFLTELYYSGDKKAGSQTVFLEEDQSGNIAGLGSLEAWDARMTREDHSSPYRGRIIPARGTNWNILVHGCFTGHNCVLGET